MPEEQLNTLEDLAQQVLYLTNEDKAASLDTYLQNITLPTMMSYAQSIQEPTSTIETRPEMVEPYRTLYRVGQDRRLRATENTFKQTLDSYHQLRGLQQQYPDLAQRVGINDDFWDKLKDSTLAVGKKGWTAVDFILRNLDRARGSMAEYATTIAQGGTENDALMRAKAVFKGSKNGWVLKPEMRGPSYKEFLIASGMDDDLFTASLGFGMDVVLDPVIILGAGAGRGAQTLTAHQILNSAGRQEYGKIIRKTALELAGVDDIKLVDDVVLRDNIIVQAQEAMRKTVNSSREAAYAYLDMGGLKIAGITLPGTSFLRTRKYTRKGVQQEDYYFESLLGAAAKVPFKALQATGSMQGTSLLGKKLAALSRQLDSGLRRAGEDIGQIFHRTSPTAGKDWINFKQAQYYDRLGQEVANIQTQIQQVFAGIHPAQLEDLSYKLEQAVDNPAVLETLTPRLKEAVRGYETLMTDVLVKEVKKGISHPEWTIQERQIFELWAWGKVGDEFVDPKLLVKFKKLKLEYYVPHIYRDTWRIAQTFSRGVSPRAPSIVEGHLKTRYYKNLTDAKMEGMIPEENLAKLASFRLYSAQRALVTHEFLESAVKEFGLDAGLAERARRAVHIVEESTPPTHSWEDIIKKRVDAYGKFTASIGTQKSWAWTIGGESEVPVALVAKFHEEPLREFLVRKFQVMKHGDAERLWQKYVVVPTERGIYNGLKAAPGKDVHDMVRIARDLNDPFYPRWTSVDVGGRKDPSTLRRAYFPKPIADDIARLQNEVLPPEVEGIFRLYDRVNFFWKKSVTVAWPAFHIRNKITNFINSMADMGLGVLLHRPLMWKVMWGHKGVLDTEVPGLSYTFDQIREYMRRYDVLRVVYRRNDIGEAVSEVLGREVSGLRLPLPGGKARPGKQTIAPPYKPFQFGGDVASLIENSDRALLYISSLKRGMSPEQAAQRVNKFLFDYEDISRWDQKVTRRLVPFITFLKKNLALQTHLATHKPIHFARMGHFINALSKEDESAMRSDVERTLLPQFFNDQLGVRTAAGPGVSRWLLNLDFPQSDMNKIWNVSWSNTASREWMGLITPYLGELTEVLFNKDFYSGQPIVEFDRSTKVYDMLKVAPQAIKDAIGMREEFDFDKEEKVIRVDSAKWKMLYVAMVFGGLGRAYTTVGKALDEDVTPSHRLWGALTGWRWTQIRPEDLVTERTTDELFHARDALKKARRRLLDEMQAASIMESNVQNMSTEDLQEEVQIVTPERTSELE